MSCRRGVFATASKQGNCGCKDGWLLCELQKVGMSKRLQHETIQSGQEWLVSPVDGVPQVFSDIVMAREFQMGQPGAAMQSREVLEMRIVSEWRSA